MNFYKALNNQIFSNQNYSLVPIRYQDRMDIMKWRNEQIYHLRQSKPLTLKDQENYFDNVVSRLFEQEQPRQILFSYLDDDTCIGYGGLVHINWNDKNAEISFIMDTELEKDFFNFHWKSYLRLIEKIAFEELNLHKIYTYAFDLRPHLYLVLESEGFNKEAVLKEHCFFFDQPKDVIIHSKINHLRLRMATIKDVELTFQWAIDKEIRKYAFNQSEIKKENHSQWFYKKLQDINCKYYILENSLGTALGSIRLDLNSKEGIISYLIDSKFFGKGLGTKILLLLENEILKNYITPFSLVGMVQKENIASLRIFNKLNYSTQEDNGIVKFKKTIQ